MTLSYYDTLKEPLMNVSPEEISHALELARKYITTKLDVIVDIGCGTGYSTYLLQQTLPNAKVIGMDLSPAALRLARKSFPNVEYVECNWLIPLDDFIKKYTPIDLVFGLGVGTTSKDNWMFLINQPLDAAYKLAGHLVLILQSPWAVHYAQRLERGNPMIAWLKIHPEGLANINKHNPIYVEYDNYRLYAVFKK